MRAETLSPMPTVALAAIGRLFAHTPESTHPTRMGVIRPRRCLGGQHPEHVSEPPKVTKGRSRHVL